MSTLKAVLIGSSVAIALVAALVLAVGLHVLPTQSAGSDSTSSVVVALVLPGSDGELAPRVIDVYSKSGGRWSVRSLSPTSSAQVPGTSGSTLADAYSFGGGRGLLAAIRAKGSAADSWVIVGPTAWAQLQAGKPVPLDLPADLEVFDGSQLYSFDAGAASVPPDQVAILLQGGALLTPREDATIRAQIGDALGLALVANRRAGGSGLSSSLAPDALDSWTASISGATRAPGD